MEKHTLVTLILFYVLTISFESCKKINPPNGKVKGETYRHQFSNTTDIDTLSYSYDQQGRVISIQHINGQETYVFNGNSYIYTPLSGVSVTGTLNSQGLVTSISNGFTYSYDQNGYLVSWLGPDFSYYYTIGNGNILEDSEVNNGNSSIQYYTHSSIIDYRDFGRSFEGKQNHNLTLSDSVSVGQKSTISYTFDSKGRVATETITGNGILFVDAFTYFD